MSSTIRIQEKDFDISAEIAALRKGDPRVGAVVSFLGAVRDMNDGSQVKGMTLEHYPGMTEKALQEILTFDNVQFADRISLHYVIEALAATQGVAYSNPTLIARVGAAQSGIADAVFALNEIPRAGTILVTVTGGIED